MIAPGTASVFAGFRFPWEVISVAVRWYLRYGLSYRDVEELLAERGVTVDHVTVYWWVQRFTPEFIEAGRPGRHLAGNRWLVDETYLRVAGKWTYVYPAVDQLIPSALHTVEQYANNPIETDHGRLKTSPAATGSASPCRFSDRTAHARAAC